MVDKMAATAAGLFLVPLAAFIICFILQFKGLVEGAERINTLNIRVALFLPLYAFVMVIAVAAPNALPALTVLLNLIESYSFYCFFVLLVTNAGGSTAMVQVMGNAGRDIMCCNPCCPKGHENMYKGVQGALWHLMVTRNIVSVLAAIANYSGSSAGQVIYTILNLVCTVLLINALMRCFLIYEMIYSNCSNVFNVYKVMMLKFSITLIVLEGLIAEFMVRFGGAPFDDDSEWSMEEQTYRGYCSLVLIEYAILTIPYLILWAMKVTPPASSMTDKQVTTAPLTFGEYVCKVIKFWDIKGVLPLNDLNKPLTQPNNQKV